MYLVTWEKKEVCDNGFIDITPGEQVCHSEREIYEIIDMVLFNQALTSDIPVNPNIHVYKLNDVTGQFTTKINELSNNDRLQKQKREHEEWLKQMANQIEQMKQTDLMQLIKVTGKEINNYA